MVHTELKYAGTLDLLFKSGDKIILMDFKTSTGIKDNKFHSLDKVKLQLAGYDLILKDIFNVNVDSYEVLHITKDGSDILEIEPDHKG
jgi:ATP-dependent exoDNAse (exonuclease V) beta subunit